jgi:hypothetical protein
MRRAAGVTATPLQARLLCISVWRPFSFVSDVLSTIGAVTMIDIKAAVRWYAWIVN